MSLQELYMVVLCVSSDALQGVIGTRYCYVFTLRPVGAVGYDLVLKNLTKISVGI